MLLQQNLSDFGPQNWKSRIRHLVSIDDKYRDLTPWHGTETADIVYDDLDGELTEILIALGYLDSATWSGQAPRYYLEVKSTREACRTKFFMTKAQHKRVRRLPVLDLASL